MTHRYKVTAMIRQHMAQGTFWKGSLVYVASDMEHGPAIEALNKAGYEVNNIVMIVPELGSRGRGQG